MEVELKLLLEPDEVRRLRRLLGPARETIAQSNRYFDDHDRTLARHGWGLRIRLETSADFADRVVLTLKHGGGASGDFSVRPEYESALQSADLEPAEVLTLARDLLPDPGALPEVEVVEVARLDNRREVYELRGAAPAVVELDHTTWPDRTESDELELEITEGVDRSVAERVLRDTLDRACIPWRVGRESKLERLMRMI